MRALACAQQVSRGEAASGFGQSQQLLQAQRQGEQAGAWPARTARCRHPTATLPIGIHSASGPHLLPDTGG